MAAEKRKDSARCVVIAGPSGVGKSTMIKAIMAKYPDQFGLSVSHTTREMRPGEEDGKNYHFVTKEKFEENVKEGKFIEHAVYAANLYGTSFAAVESVLQAGKLCILDIEMKGVQSVKKSELNSKTCYVMLVPPSFEELEKRLRGRGDTSEEAIQRRLAQAKEELEMQEKKDFWDSILISDVKEETQARMLKFLGFE
mmetsp:Transcript_5407/g.6963  ORF Transcript_5407/g.6963 Transcript_5407/m.6963 type:complete len:197 (+) Transcript_5407:58-648(+)|eukprot:CAMPEP_0201487782 /NCGR_PEP_ID=MMETSP0151_2-20130828/15224_1 /ASSEMBLY_ACC=CAM_ASM_000257 /TAXON_ID=200890 /ORGANISM="Paramoeba atlantica, Strain 621/1 / CCAP 1560/9" /LENGTH=196 /DNA_ID=CAMNT_0047872927 /DNA_START=54 /DNA_END=644 /DNA_ORIENTATION=-